MDVRIYDNGGESFDRYTAIFPDGYALGIGPTGNAPNGFCMTVDAVEGPHLGVRVAIEDVPEPVQRVIRAETVPRCIYCGDVIAPSLTRLGSLTCHDHRPVGKRP